LILLHHPQDYHKNMSFSGDVEQGLLHSKHWSYLYGAVEHNDVDDGDQRTASCSDSSASSSSAAEDKEEELKTTFIDSESSPLTTIILPDQQSVSSDDSSSQDCSESDNGSQKQSSRLFHSYHEYDMTRFTTEHSTTTDWTVSEGTVSHY
jgi:hypothetical protein